MTAKDVEVKEQLSMKEEFLNTISELKKIKTDFTNRPPMFKWSYPEEPELEFSLLIKTLEEAPEKSKIILAH